jgi:hypothetical protein
MTQTILDAEVSARITDADWSQVRASASPTHGFLTELDRPEAQITIDVPTGRVTIDAPQAPPWFEAVVTELFELLQLPPGWDSYSAPTVDLNHVLAAIQILLEITRDSSPRPAVVPTNRGHVQLEWHYRGIDLEIETLSPCRFSAYFSHSAQGEEWEAEIGLNRGRLVHYMDLLSR